MARSGAALRVWAEGVLLAPLGVVRRSRPVNPACVWRIFRRSMVWQFLLVHVGKVQTFLSKICHLVSLRAVRILTS